MVSDAPPIVPRRARRLEHLPARDGGAEILAPRMRRLFLKRDAHWLLERIDGVSNVAVLAGEISHRFGRDVTPDDALALVRGTLVAHGLVELPAPGTPPKASPALVPALRWNLLPATRVARWAGAASWLASPPIAFAGLLGAFAAGAIAAAEAVRVGRAAWTDPAAWALAVPAALASLLVHELGHALALARAGGRPGDVSLWWCAGQPRLSVELEGLDALGARERAAVDVAGMVAQLVSTGAAAAVARALGLSAAPVLALTLALALGNLLPVPGSDGRWLLDDLARRDPADRLSRPVSPFRWLSRAYARLAALAAVALGRGAFREQSNLLPVLVSASFPHWSPGRLRAHTREFISMQAVIDRDQRDLLKGAMADEVRHVRPIRTLLGEGRGAVVCAMHVGPYAFVPEALCRLGARVLAYAAPNQMRRWSEIWIESARRRGSSLELLSPLAARDTVRAVRGVREGALLYVLMDGQIAMARDQHRADFRFLGNQLFMRTAPALLARRTGVPLVLAATRYAGVARRVIEFSDLLPPPDSDDEAVLVARTAEMYAWFEPRVERVSAQWDGWTWPIMHWRATGRAPTATPDELAKALRRAREALAGRPANARVAAERTHVHWTRSQDEYLIIHGPPRRVLVATALACRVLEAAHRRTRVRELPSRTGATPEALAPELARLALAGLVTLEA